MNQLKGKIIVVILVALCFLAVPAALAHAPLGTGDNESIDKATVIPDPTKSWALYAQLSSDGDAQYYTFNITSGQRIHAMLYKSMRSQDASFTPRLVIMGPNIAPQGNVSSKITVPAGVGAQLVTQASPQPTFEPFSPSTFVGLADLTIENPTPGKYYLVVYEESSTPQGGNYGLAVGDRETYTIDEWILIPFNLMSIYEWEGQSLALILAPMMAALTAGIVFTAWRLRRQGHVANPMAWLGAVGGSTFVGTAATTLYQLLAAATQVAVGTEAVVTMIFAIIPLVLGLAALRLSIRNSQKVNTRKRVSYVVLGAAALFMWAGLIIGPLLAVAASVMPTGMKKRQVD